MAANRYKVPQKQWRKWCDLSRRVFNALYRQLLGSPDIVWPTCKPRPRDWKVLAWNAAWLAADQTEGQLAAIAEGK